MSETVLPVFTKEMKATHTILVPNMLPFHFALLRSALQSCGYKAEILQNTGRNVIETGLKYVNSDICYPALLVIGQIISALESGRYDLSKTALCSARQAAAAALPIIYTFCVKAWKKLASAMCQSSALM